MEDGRVKAGSRVGAGHGASSLYLALFAVAAMFVAAASASAVQFGGVEYPLGEISFADDVVAFSVGPGVVSSHADPEWALGPPDFIEATHDNAVSLGEGGSLTIRFVDNGLIDQDAVEDGRDLFIYEVGGQVEWFKVEISKDGGNWVDLGTLKGQPTGIDIKPFCDPGDVFYYVRVTDDPTQVQSAYPWAGADIDAIGAIGARAEKGTVSLAGFETTRYPWGTLAAGPGTAGTWREMLSSQPWAHTGEYVMSSEIADQGITGMLMALPTEPTGQAEISVRSWVYVADRTEPDSSTFFGFKFDEEYPVSGASWSGYVGWEALSDSSSRFQLLDSAQPAGIGLTAGSWHQVEVRYVCGDGSVTLSLDGEQVSTIKAPAAKWLFPRYAVLGAWGGGQDTRHTVHFDDSRVWWLRYAGLPSRDRIFGLIDGPERLGLGQTQTYTLHYGNGYPLLGTSSITSPGSDRLYLGVTMPPGYAFESADLAPSQTADGVVTWDVAMPPLGQAGDIHLLLTTPQAAPTPVLDRIWVWATEDSNGADTVPPAISDWTSPGDPTWGAPRDVLPQQFGGTPRVDLWASVLGPPAAKPGETIYYLVSVGNAGTKASSDVVVRQVLPEIAGGRDLIVADLAGLDVAEDWTGVASVALPATAAEGTLVTNQAYVAAETSETNTANNRAEWETTVNSSYDGPSIAVLPVGPVDRGDTLTYTVTCKNNLGVTVYGAYAIVRLDRKLDDSTLILSDPKAAAYDVNTHSLDWEIGELGAGETKTIAFAADVSADALRARPVVGVATIYYPSAGQQVPTNVVVNVIKGSFPDVPADYWALLPIELTRDAGIVLGFGDGTYGPTGTVSRDQMAVFISRAIAGGDANVTPGPAKATFPDVPLTPTKHWAYDYIEYACAHGIVLGYPTGLYGPTDPVDRGQMAVFISRAIAEPMGEDGMSAYTPPTNPTFPDVTKDNDWAWAHKYVEYAAASGVVQGYEDGTYGPGTPCTRDQIAVFVARAFRLPM